MKRLFQKALSLIVCLAILVGMGGVFVEPAQTYAAGVDVGANPTPKIDIAVNVPSDYPGTFLEFKQELTEKLIEQGLDASSFRITTTAVSIDTTDLNGWYVYDHYYGNDQYNDLHLSEEQQLKQPYRPADNSNTSGGIVTMESLLKNGNISGCRNFTQHIWSYADDEGKASMVFAGYGTQGYADYMIYPAASNARRTISFDLDANAIGPHTLNNYGFLLNAGIENGRLIGYAVVFKYDHSTGCIQKVNLDANFSRGANGSNFLGSAASATANAVSDSKAMPLGSTKKARMTVELNKNSVTVQAQQYDAAGNLGPIQTLWKDVPLEDTGYNGFGPVVEYQSHGCSELTVFRYLDLEMSYEASAFDALKNVQYYEGADFKYFINLAGDSNDPQIPEELTKDGQPNENYSDGVNRMNENEIFYISNADDGKIVTDSVKDENGELTHQGLGSSNGYYASGDNYTELMAQYIYTNYQENKKFQQAEVLSDLPLANFYIKDAATADSQLMTIHLQHLVKAAEYNANHDDKQQETVEVNIFDKSKIGTVSGSDGKLVEWTLTVTDPDNTVVDGFNKVKVDDPSKLPNFIFNKDSKSGRYTFTLVVKDQAGNESKDFSTYITAFLDDKEPYIEGANTGKNIATITLTDTGSGIDEDGITFIEDDRGSGVAAYWVTNDKDAEPSAEDWEVLPFAQHSYAFELEVTDTLPLVVWVKDECGNIGNKAVFQPTHVVVEDPDGNPIDDYYVIGEKPIIVLPPDEDVPEHPDDPENNHFSGWETPGGDPVTPGTTPDPDESNTIVIRPGYSTDMAKIIYLANGGSIKTSAGDQAVSEYSVISGSSILKKIDDHGVIPHREGYSFTGWKLLKSGNSADAGNETFINNAANLEDVSEQRALKVTDDSGITTRDTYYLVAQWKVGEYTLRLDPNGGSYGNMKSIENVLYNANIGTLTTPAVPISGRGIPTKPGYIFKGWSESNDNDQTKIFKVAQGITGITPVEAPLMPASDKTIYAVWEKDTRQFVVNFDSNGGSRISDQAYLIATDNNYNTFLKPSRTGYTFAGWFEKVADEAGNVSFGETEYVGGETFIKKEAHSFIAKWTPNTNTKYTVDYYVNSGNKDANGEYIYTKVNDNSINKTYEATTEAVVSVADADKLAEITVGGVKYWYNADNSKNVLEGVVTGSPALSLKLYYDRYFDVTATKKGEGTVNGASGIKEGQNATVSWEADDGSYVSKVVVDGAIRDDLLKETSYTFEVDGGFHENHVIYVEFTSEAETPSKPVNPNPPADVTKYYEVRTSVVGCTDPAKYDVTPTTSVKAGDNHTVSWNIKDSNYRIVKIEVDGIDYGTANNSSVDFNGISGDHSVVITVETLPTMGGTSEEGKYTVTVNRYGGDDNVSVSQSVVVDAGGKATVSWDATGSEYVVYNVLVDGEPMFTGDVAQKYTTSKKPFNNIQANHVVDIYLVKPDDSGDVTPPDYKDDKFVQVETQIVGAPGSITGGAVLEQGSNYNVGWNVELPTNNDPDTDGYKFYEIEKVVVGDEVVYTKGEEVLNPEDVLKSVDLSDIQEDTKVTVYAKPVLHRVTILKYGEGTVSPSKSVYHMANYRDLGASPDAGWSLVKIVVDNDVTFDIETPEVATFAARMMRAAARAGEPSIDDLEEIIEDHVIEVYFTKDAEDGNKTPAPDPSELHKVNVVIEGGAGTTESSSIVNDGANSNVSWTITDAAKYEVKEITVNGVKRDGNDPFVLENITEDMNVVITLGEKEVKDNNVVTPPTLREVVHKITAIIKGEAGTINGAGDVADGSDREITWSAAEGNEVKYVFVNGALRDDLLEAGSVSFENVTEDQTVVVIIGKPDVPPVNVDKDGDGKPDINIDDDDDGKPDVNIDKDGDGEPDVNIDTDDDGEPDINIDKDGDGEPDVNIDTDDDGEPDINIDKDGDGEPDVNIDKDGDGKPDVNVDTDDDGEPDINIDKDGDGEPDVNVDTDDDGKPDINIDKDGDGEPDINIDTDKDGEPDVNVDTDGDGEPDINIDTNDDGKPDINIDTDKDGKPDINIDKDGDGEPDINIDTNDDGKPDINIDINKDGKPEINIDTNKDGKPDVNVDLNGDWVPDVNIDTTGDGKPDTNIDADGNGIPDEQEKPPVKDPDDDNKGNDPEKPDDNKGNDTEKPDDNKGGNTDKPNTGIGDTADSFTMVWIILSVASLLAIAVLLFAVKRRKSE